MLPNTNILQKDVFWNTFIYQRQYFQARWILMWLMCASHGTASFPTPQNCSLGLVVFWVLPWTEQCSNPVLQQENQPTENAETKMHLGSKVRFLSLISRSTEEEITAGLHILNIKQHFLKASKQLLNIIPLTSKWDWSWEILGDFSNLLQEVKITYFHILRSKILNVK